MSLAASKAPRAALREGQACAPGAEENEVARTFVAERFATEIALGGRGGNRKHARWDVSTVAVKDAGGGCVYGAP